MEWLFGSKTSANTQTPLQQQKTRQIESLQTLKNYNLREIRKDSEYQFPQMRPTVQVTPPLRHPWVDPSMFVVGCRDLVNFGVHTDLSRVVRSIIAEFEKNPPMVFPTVTQPAPAPYPTPPPPTLPPSLPYSPYPSNQRLPPMQPLPGNRPPPPRDSAEYIPQYASPTIQAAAEFASPTPAQEESVKAAAAASSESFFPEVGRLSLTELEELNENEGKLIDYFSALPRVHQLQDQRQAHISQCEEIANINLSYQPLLEEKKRRLDIGQTALESAKSEFDANCRKQQDMTQSHGALAVLNNLKVVAMEAEEESESVAEMFLGSQMDSKLFLEQYLSKRTLYHMRRTKEEKLQHMLDSNSF